MLCVRRLPSERCCGANIQAGCCLLQADARFAASHDLEKPALRVIEKHPPIHHWRLHHHGYPNVLHAAHSDTIEPWRSDADDGKRQTVERDGFAHRSRVKPELALPISVADHCDRVSARDTVFL